MTVLKAFLKNVYGIEKCYLKDSEQSEAIKQLTGKKTLAVKDIENLKALGIDIIIEAEKTVFEK